MIYKDNLIELNLPRKKTKVRKIVILRATKKNDREQKEQEWLAKFNTDFILEMRKRYLIKLHKTMGDTEEGRKQATALLSIFDEWMFR